MGWPNAPHRVLQSCIDAASAFDGDMVGETEAGDAMAPLAQVRASDADSDDHGSHRRHGALCRTGRRRGTTDRARGRHRPRARGRRGRALGPSSTSSRRPGVNRSRATNAVRRAGTADIDAACAVLADAFSDYAWTRWTVDGRDHGRRIEGLQRLFIERVGLPYGEVWIALDEHGLVASAAVWMLPESVVPESVTGEMAAAQAELEGDRHEASVAARRASPRCAPRSRTTSWARSERVPMRSDADTGRRCSRRYWRAPMPTARRRSWRRRPLPTSRSTPRSASPSPPRSMCRTAARTSGP